MKTCGAVPSSPFGGIARSRGCRDNTVEVVVVLPWLSWLQAVPPWLLCLATAGFIQAKFAAWVRNESLRSADG